MLLFGSMLLNLIYPKLYKPFKHLGVRTGLDKPKTSYSVVLGVRTGLAEPNPRVTQRF